MEDDPNRSAGLTNHTVTPNNQPVNFPIDENSVHAQRVKEPRALQVVSVLLVILFIAFIIAINVHSYNVNR
jgi:hypothetical protein